MKRVEMWRNLHNLRQELNFWEDSTSGLNKKNADTVHAKGGCTTTAVKDAMISTVTGKSEGVNFSMDTNGHILFLFVLFLLQWYRWFEI